ncbi:Uncharacterised protein [uncultured archaeon]|nr:Uncharacterised protein [uncultured archaeon]
MHKRKSRTAMITADMIVAAVIFVSMVSVSFYYMSYMSRPKQPLGEALQVQGLSIAEKLANNVSWTVYKLPIIADSKNQSYASFEQYFQPDASIDANSLAILDSNSNEIPSSFSENTLIWTANISASKNIFYLVYTENTALQARTYATDLSASGLWANNSLIKVLFSSSGISNINFGGTEMLGNGIYLGTSGSPQNNALAMRAKVNYTNGLSAKVYSNISKIMVKSNTAFNPVLNFSSALTNYYNGSANAFSGTRQQFNSILNFTDIYSALSGVAIIGNNLNISVLNTGYREVRLYNVTEFEIYVHSGDYSNATVERDMYLNPPSVVIGIPAQIKGVSTDNLNALAALPYPALKNAFSGSTNFNLSLEGANAASIGKSIPSDRDVRVVRYPATILGRLGNTSDTYFVSATWLGGDYA